jgi:hypothetical protein
MLDSVPVPFQAILWPLAGAACVLALGRLLPNWLRRLVALVAALASLAALWSLRSGTVEQLEVVWEPLQYFRMSPRLYSDGLSLLVGLLLAGLGAAAVLGIRGREPRKTVWHGWILVALAGSLATILGANLLALALGSALLDLALIAVVVLDTDGAGPERRMPLSVTVPGIASTLLLYLGALQMDSQVGHASLLSRNLPEQMLVWLGAAGVLRALVYPLHPRRLERPEDAAILLLPVAVGGYLLLRVQALAPILTEQAWMMIMAMIAVLAGGVLAWSSGGGLPARRDSGALFSKFWPGALVQQTGFAIVFVLLLAGMAPWPLVGLVLALGALAIWWESGLEEPEPAGSVRWEWLTRRLEPWWERAGSAAVARVPRLRGWRASWVPRYGVGLLPAIAVASLAGVPLTVGARGRWSLYATWLGRGDSALLIGLVADTLLAAGLWTTLRSAFRLTGQQRPGAVTLLAVTALVLPVVILGIAPDLLGDSLGLRVAQPTDVSVWGLGLLYLLPWLLGIWLARMRGRLKGLPGRVYGVVNLDWAYRAASWVGRRLVSGVHWLGKVGEGEGWWGWVLIILALGVILLTVR